MPDLIVRGKGECKLHASRTISASVTGLQCVNGGLRRWGVGGVLVLPTRKSHHLFPSLSSPITRPPFAHPSPSPLTPRSPPSSITPPSQFSPHSFFSPFVLGTNLSFTPFPLTCFLHGARVWSPNLSWVCRQRGRWMTAPPACVPFLFSCVCLHAVCLWAGFSFLIKQSNHVCVCV